MKRTGNRLPERPFETAIRQITFSLRRIEDQLLVLLRHQTRPGVAPTLVTNVQAVGRAACGAVVNLWPAVCDLEEILGTVADLRRLADAQYPFIAVRDAIGAALDRLSSFRETTASMEELARQTWGIAPPDPADALAGAVRDAAAEIADVYDEMCSDLDAIAGILHFIEGERSANPPASTPVDPFPVRLEATFRCQQCDTPAGVVVAYWTTIAGAKRPGGIHVFSTVVGLTEPIAVDRSIPLEAALRAADAKALFAIDPRYAPFFCNECAAAYCGEHWTIGATFDRGQFTGTHAVCPRRHVRTE